MHFIHGRKNTIICDSVNFDQANLNYLTVNVNQKLKLNKPQVIFLQDTNLYMNSFIGRKRNIVKFAGKKIQLISEETKYLNDADFLIFTKTIKKKLEKTDKKIIFLKRYKNNAFENLNIHETSSDGAFVFDFKDY